MSYEYICHKTINNILYESSESGNIDELIYIFENHYKNIYVKKEYIFYLEELLLVQISELNIQRHSLEHLLLVWY